MLTIEQKIDLIEKQIEFQHKIQSVGMNLVNIFTNIFGGLK